MPHLPDSGACTVGYTCRTFATAILHGRVMYAALALLMSSPLGQGLLMEEEPSRNLLCPMS